MNHAILGMRAAVCLLLALAFSSVIAGEPESNPVSFSGDDPALEWGPCPPFFDADCRIAVVHGDPAGNNADVLFRYPAGKAFVEHWHSSAERMVLLEGQMTVTYAGHDPVTLEPGQYAFGPAKAHHHGSCTSDSDCLLFIAFEKPIDAFEVGAE